MPPTTANDSRADAPLIFHGGMVGAVLPLVLFLAGVVWLGLAGAPDERGFWPVLVAALALGLILARDRTAYSETLIQGMSQPIVMIMIMAWLLAGILASLMNASGFVEALVWAARQAGVAGGGFAVASFLIACLVSTSTGTSLGTLILCSPLLYPAGGALGTDPAILIGAILGGATFGDNVSPVSDTTIASALTQQADIRGVVWSRLRYALPAAAVAMVAYGVLGGGGQPAAEAAVVTGSPKGLPMLAAPIVAIALLLRGRHLLHGLFGGILTATGLGLVLGLIQPAQLLRIDAASYAAQSLYIDGIGRGIGVSIFTILLMGLIAGFEATGAMDRLLQFAGERIRSAAGAEWWIFAAVSAAVLLTTHPVVAILAVGPLALATGRQFGIDRYRRSNILDVTVCTYPFFLPYFIPAIIAASTTADAGGFGMPRLSPFTAGIYNFHSWALLAVMVISIATGFGRSGADTQTTQG